MYYSVYRISFSSFFHFVWHHSWVDDIILFEWPPLVTDSVYAFCIFGTSVLLACLPDPSPNSRSGVHWLRFEIIPPYDVMCRLRMTSFRKLAFLSAHGQIFGKLIISSNKKRCCRLDSNPRPWAWLGADWQSRLLDHNDPVKLFSTVIFWMTQIKI